jgi:hypothetical protein
MQNTKTERKHGMETRSTVKAKRKQDTANTPDSRALVYQWVATHVDMKVVRYTNTKTKCSSYFAIAENVWKKRPEEKQTFDVHVPGSDGVIHTACARCSSNMEIKTRTPPNPDNQFNVTLQEDGMTVKFTCLKCFSRTGPHDDYLSNLPNNNFTWILVPSKQNKKDYWAEVQNEVVFGHGCFKSCEVFVPDSSGWGTIPTECVVCGCDLHWPCSEPSFISLVHSNGIVKLLQYCPPCFTNQQHQNKRLRCSASDLASHCIIQ